MSVTDVPTAAAAPERQAARGDVPGRGEIEEIPFDVEAAMEADADEDEYLANPQPSDFGELMIRVFTPVTIVVPFVAAILIAWWALPPSPVDMALLLLLTAFSMVGVTVGYHRLFSHRSFVAKPWLRYTLAIAGLSSWERTPTWWAALHRQHHQYTDRPGDPYSAHLSGPGVAGLLKGFWHSHTGWLFSGVYSDAERYAPDLLADRRLRRIEDWWWTFPAFFSFVLPPAVGYLLAGPVGALTSLLWVGFIKIGIVHHFTFSLNSICHLWGKRPYRARGQATNVAWLALFTFGDSWHNTHHAFPKYARHGADPGQLDPGAWLIRQFERLGWATNVHWPDRERMQSRRVS